MDEERLKIWETLFQRALTIIDSVAQSGYPLENWSFGGGTVLMRRHHHRFSKDIDIFIPDPQYLGHLTPRLNNDVEILTTHYIEQKESVKLILVLQTFLWVSSTLSRMVSKEDVRWTAWSCTGNCLG